MAGEEDKLRKMGFELPQPLADESNNIRAVRVDRLLFVSAHSYPQDEAHKKYDGKVGKDLDLKTAQEAATEIALLILATIKKHLGDLGKVKRIVRTYGVVQSTPDFTMQTAILNVASDLFIEVFGRERGTGTRLPIAAVSAGHNYSILLDMIIEVAE
jgi:enamine deaminase RidA (YjgF/YER057c/UK114 family)